MKKQPTKLVSSFKDVIVKSAVLTCLLLLLQVGGTLAQVYARLELEVVTTPSPHVTQRYAMNSYVRYYSDAACTMPTTLPGNMLININVDKVPPASSSPQPFQWQAYANEQETNLGLILLDEWNYSDEENTNLIWEVHWQAWLESDGNENNSYIVVPEVLYY